MTSTPTPAALCVACRTSRWAAWRGLGSKPMAQTRQFRPGAFPNAASKALAKPSSLSGRISGRYKRLSCKPMFVPTSRYKCLQRNLLMRLSMAKRSDSAAWTIPNVASQMSKLCRIAVLHRRARTEPRARVCYRFLTGTTVETAKGRSCSKRLTIRPSQTHRRALRSVLSTVRTRNRGTTTSHGPPRTDHLARAEHLAPPGRRMHFMTEADVCTICLTELEAGERGTLDACEHAFCYECIRQWLNESSTCPSCKAPATTLMRHSADANVAAQVVQIAAVDNRQRGYLASAAEMQTDALLPNGDWISR